MTKEYIIHKAVDYSAASAAFRRQYTLDQLADNFIAQPKHDGCNTIFIFDGESGHALSRTGEPVPQFGDLQIWFRENGFPAGIYLGEAWHPNLSFPEISGTFRRQYIAEGKDRLRLVVFDYLTLDEWRDGYSPVPYTERVERMGSFLTIPYVVNDAPAYPIQGFGYMREKWPAAAPQDIANKLVAAGGYDGLILRDPAGDWCMGDNGKNGQIIKVKPFVSLTLEVIGTLLSVGEKTGRAVHRIEVRLPDGKSQVVGSGVPHKLFDVPKIGELVEVEAMGYTEDGCLREPRYKGIRSDANSDA